jgi:hypothetical protein
MTNGGRTAALVGGVVAEFVVLVVALLAMLPGKRAPVDYLVIGTLATFLSLATVFGILLATRKKPVDKSTERE